VCYIILLLAFQYLAEKLIHVLLGISLKLVTFWLIVSMLMQWSDHCYNLVIEDRKRIFESLRDLVSCRD